MLFLKTLPFYFRVLFFGNVFLKLPCLAEQSSYLRLGNKRIIFVDIGIDKVGNYLTKKADRFLHVLCFNFSKSLFIVSTFCYASNNCPFLNIKFIYVNTNLN